MRVLKASIASKPYFVWKMSTCSVFIDHRDHNFGILLAKPVFEWWLAADASRTASRINTLTSLCLFWWTCWENWLFQGWDRPTSARESWGQFFCGENRANSGCPRATFIDALRYSQILSADCIPLAESTIWAEQQARCPFSPSKNTHVLSQSQQSRPSFATLSRGVSCWLHCRSHPVTIIVSFSWVCNTSQLVCSSILLRKYCKESKPSRIHSEGNVPSILLLQNGNSKVYSSLLFRRKAHRISSKGLAMEEVSQRRVSASGNASCWLWKWGKMALSRKAATSISSKAIFLPSSSFQ